MEKHCSRTAKSFAHLSHLAPYRKRLSYLAPYKKCVGEQGKKGRVFGKTEYELNAIKRPVDVKGGMSHNLADVVGRCLVAQHVQDFLLELPFLDIGRSCGFRPLED